MRNADEHIHTFSDGENIVSMAQYAGRMLVATNRDIYELVGVRLVRLRLDIIYNVPPLAIPPDQLRSAFADIHIAPF